MKNLARYFQLLLLAIVPLPASAQSFKLNDRGFFESRGVEVHLYESSDGLRFYQKDVLLVSSGGVSVNGDIVPKISENLNIAGDKAEIRLDFDSPSAFLKANPSGLGIELSVFLSAPLPARMKDSVRLELNLNPSLYIGRTCIVDGCPFIFTGEKLNGKSVILAPDDNMSRIAISSDIDVSIVKDGNNIRISSSVPSEKVGDALQWYVETSYDARLAGQAEIDYSRIGYVNGQRKNVVVTIGTADEKESFLKVYKISEDGYRQQILQTSVKEWGRKDDKTKYLTSDFSMLRETGIYCVEYGNVSSDAFVVSENVFDGKWKAALKRLPAAMDVASCDKVASILRVSRLWEQFRPEDDFSGNGVPDVIDVIESFASALADAAAEELSADDTYRKISALAMSSRVLRSFDDDLSVMLEHQAETLWNAIAKSQSDFKFGTAIQMWLTTGEVRYKNVYYPLIAKNLSRSDGFESVLPVYQFLDSKSKSRIDEFKFSYSTVLKTEASSTPYGIPDPEAAGLVGWALDYYLFWLNFPEYADSSKIFACLSALYGRHSFADDSLLNSIPAELLPDFIALSIAAEKMAALPQK